jgi:hypothetical protein
VDHSELKEGMGYHSREPADNSKADRCRLAAITLAGG